MVYFRWLQDDGTETGDVVYAYLDEVGKDGWEKFSATLTIPDSGTAPKHLMMLIYGSRGTAAPWEYEIDNVQLELGSVATEFEHRSYGEELALCQRYYEKWSGSKAMHPQYSSEASGVYAAARELWNDFKVEKRSNPMVTVGGSPTPTAVNASIYGFGAQVSVASSTASVRISEWTANAEL
ncbi:MAG: hypothetical protein GY918_02355 [Gammaproteobacteria bacterium]|nr:hypothetical protein [Gammaproteobacteria bacterium]